MTTTTTTTTTNLIINISRYLCEKYTFSYYDKDDIFQEAFIIGMEGLKVFDETKGASLSTFLFMYINNRLKTFKRNNYIRNSHKCNSKNCTGEETCPFCERRKTYIARKKNIMDPITLVNDSNMLSKQDFIADIELEELKTIIDNNLPIIYRADYLRMLNNLYVPKNRKTQIEQVILDIIYDKTNY